MKLQLLVLAFGLCLLTACSKEITVEDIEAHRFIIMRDCDTGAVIRSTGGGPYDECLSSPNTEEEEEE